MLEYEEELLSPHAQAARVAYRTGRTDFDNAVENIEEMWRKLCSSMPEDVGKCIYTTLAVLKDVSGISKTHQFKDVLRNLSNIYIDEGANIAYKDFFGLQRSFTRKYFGFFRRLE